MTGDAQGVKALRDALGEAAAIALPVHDDRERCSDHLYQHWYLGLPVDSHDASTPVGACPAEALHLNLRGALRCAHAAARQWDDGWVVRHVAPGGVVTVERDGAVRSFARVDVLPVERATLAPRPGDAVAVTARRDTDQVPGAWVTYGGAWPDEGQPPDLHRYYVHIQERSVLALVHAATTRLESAGVTYAVKVITGSGRFVRPDAAVCYSPADEAGELRTMLVDLVDNGGLHLTPTTPRLAAVIRPGLAWALDPGGNRSFGEWWCRFISAHVASGLASGAVTGDPVPWLATHLVEASIDAGVDPDSPHLLAHPVLV